MKNCRFIFTLHPVKRLNKACMFFSENRRDINNFSSMFFKEIRFPFHIQKNIFMFILAQRRPKLFTRSVKRLIQVGSINIFDRGVKLQFDEDVRCGDCLLQFYDGRVVHRQKLRFIFKRTLYGVYAI